MALDKDTVDFIVKQNELLEGHLVEKIQDNGVAVRGLVREQIDRIKEMDEKRNGRIDDNEHCIHNLKKETRLSRFAQRNAGKMIIGFIIVVAIISIAASQLNVKRSIEKRFKIDLIDDE